MFKFILLVAISIEMFNRTDAILGIRWQQAPTDVNNNASHLVIDCFTELTLEHVDKIIGINPDSLVPRRACLIRIPTKVDVLFSLAAVHKRSTLHILSGDTQFVQGPSTGNLNRRRSYQNSFTARIYVGCNFGTISFKPRDSYDKLVFLMKNARPELIESEDTEKCT